MEKIVCVVNIIPGKQVKALLCCRFIMHTAGVKAVKNEQIYQNITLKSTNLVLNFVHYSFCLETDVWWESFGVNLCSVERLKHFKITLKRPELVDSAPRPRVQGGLAL